MTVNTGVTVKSTGVYVTAGLTVFDSGVVLTGGLTVINSGLKVTGRVILKVKVTVSFKLVLVLRFG
jgi:hypothetical protein